MSKLGAFGLGSVGLANDREAAIELGERARIAAV
jgi:hypothetical protein